MTKENLGITYTVIAHFFVLGYFIFTKLSFNYYNVFTTVVFWFGSSAIVSFLVILFSRRLAGYKILKKHWRLIIIYGIFASGSVLTSFYSLQLLGPSLTGFLAKLTVLSVIGMGVVFLKEKFNALEIISAAVVMLGVFLISFSKGEYITTGILVIIIHSIIFAISRYIVKAKMANIEPFFIVHFRALTITVFVLIFSLAIGKFEPSISKGLLFATVPSVFSVILHHLFIFKAYKLIAMSKVALLGNIESFMVLLAAFLVFGEVLTPLQLAGGIIIIIGVVALILSRKKEKAVI